MKIASEHGDLVAAAVQTEVEVQIRGLMIDPLTNMPVVVLKDVAGERCCRSGWGSSRPMRLRWSWRRRRCRDR